jgi:hypothetical protein
LISRRRVTCASRPDHAGGEKAESTKDDPFLGYDFAVLFPDLPLYSDFAIASLELIVVSATEASKIGFRKVMRFWIC